MIDEAQEVKPTVTVAKYGDRIASDKPVNELIDVHGEGAVIINGKSIAQHIDDAVAGVESEIAGFLHSIAGFADRVAARLQAKADEATAAEQAAEIAAAEAEAAQKAADEQAAADKAAADAAQGGANA